MPLVEPEPPQDIEAEQAVLGCMMLEGEAASLVTSSLQRGDFHRSSHGIIFDALRHIVEADRAPDILQLRDSLARIGKLEECGGNEYLYQLAAAVPSAANVEAYIAIVREKAEARRLIRACTMGLQDAESMPSAEAMARMTERLEGVAKEASSFRILTMADAMDAADALGGATAQSSGLNDLDRALKGGYHHGGFTLVGGDSGAGKTVLALQAVRMAIAQFVPVFIISRDQLFAHLAERIWSAESGVPREMLRTDERSLRIKEFMRAWPLFWHAGTFDKASVCASIRVAALKHKTTVWILDYLQRIEAPGAEANKAPVEIAEALADVAQDTNTAGVVISRVTKPNQGVPTQHRFAGEAGVQNAADTMIFVHKLSRPEIAGGPRVIEVIGKRYCGDKSVLAIMEGDLDRYRNATELEKEQWRGQMRGAA